MDGDFFHCEWLLHRAGLIQSIFSQNNRVAAVFGVGAERQMYNSPIKLLSSLCTCCAYSKWSHFLPIGKTVGSCQDPAGGDQTAPATENLLLGFAAPKYGSDPWVGFHSGNCSTHNLHLFSGALTTSGLCIWRVKQSSEQSRKNMEMLDRFSEAWTHLFRDQQVQAKVGQELQDQICLD